MKAYLYLEDGTLLEGNLAGVPGTAYGEVCFNTGMTGYQEIFTDPSYFGQIVIMTGTHIGNYGTDEKENESAKVQISGLVCKEFSEFFSGSMGRITLNSFLKKNELTSIYGIDTRRLVAHIRRKGAMNALITNEKRDDFDELLKLNCRNMNGADLSTEVTTPGKYSLVSEKNSTYRVAVLDYGVKVNILRSLNAVGCDLTVFPARTTYEEIEDFEPEGVFLSNGPGDPSAMDFAVDLVKKITKKGIPTFGICLGHQLLALAYGAKTYKMRFGHRGLNHPVKNLLTGACEITSQNHGFSVDPESLKNNSDLTLTHINLNDHSVEGLHVKNERVFSVQYHPEASPGPHDSHYLFRQFRDTIKI